MKILITGAAGFIGSHLVHYHLHKGDEVWGIDNFSIGSKDNLASIQHHPQFRFSEHSLQSWKELDTAVLWADRIYHMAALLGLKFVFSHPFQVLSDNIHSCESVLQSAVKSKKALQILISSSSCVYGSHDVIVDKPESSILPTVSGEYFQETYSVSKIVNEVMTLSSAANSKMHAVIARFFNIIGPHQTGRYGMVVPTFVEQALQGYPITVYGDGSQTRSFCSVHDAIRSVELLFNSSQSNQQIYNIGSYNEISILDLAHRVKKRAHSSSEIVFVPYDKAYGIDYKEIKRRKPVLTKLTQAIGYEAKSSLDEILDEIILDKKKQLKL